MGHFIRPAVNDILSDLPKFRILVVGKSGCGKTALLSKVFAVDANPENGDIVERDEGVVSPKIQGGLTFRKNNKFILYTSSNDFLPNSDSDFDEIRHFIRKRLDSEIPRNKIHAVWVCLDTPLGGERLSESGVERILEVANKKVPIIIVLTKFDLLVNSTRSTRKKSESSNDDEVDETREEAERLLDYSLKKASLDSLLSQQLVTPVSIMVGYEDTVSALIQATDGVIQRFQGTRMHDAPTTLAWAVAQRQDIETTIAAVIDVGRERHWGRLGSTTEFEGRSLEQYISIIHEDIIAIWNIQDSSSYLRREDFKARMSHLVEDLALIVQNDVTIFFPGRAATLSAATASPIAASGGVAEAAKWVSDAYHATPKNIACIVGYVVDLIMVLILLSEIHQSQETVSRRGLIEDAVNAIKAYVTSELLSTIHKEIRELTMANKLCDTADRGDAVPREIERLVSNFYLRAKDSAKNVIRKVPSQTANSTRSISHEQPTKGESVRSHRLLSVIPQHNVGPSAHILTIVEEATRTPASRSSFEGAQRSTLLVPGPSPSEALARSPLNPLNWIRREHRVVDEEAGIV